MSIMIPAWIDGTLTPVEKLEAHQRGLRHKAVSVFVIRGTEVLMQQRAMGKYHTPGLWANTCCTHPDWDEAPLDCAVRRLDEEVGITGLPLTHRHHLEYRAEVGNGLVEHEVVDVFLGRAPQGLTVVPNPDEVMAVEWMDFHDLMAQVCNQPERFTPWLRIYLTDHAETIFGADLEQVAGA
ncbi:isopentenyl-diphosphate Delta-isomerase [uncultured Tateyamaria sp.]|uniref:isopentenyl-diphosphate Delta-isomerase n=1 Tax=uncultured Tateyamaria sp. TaxID=455651 RepID=UPI00260E66C6|nr:isopentenyl-diphosphate Delta-isomerase [uncultured Tateyamaria sp.]